LFPRRDLFASFFFDATLRPVAFFAFVLDLFTLRLAAFFAMNCLPYVWLRFTVEGRF
jgi:hypothetical protein